MTFSEGNARCCPSGVPVHVAGRVLTPPQGLERRGGRRLQHRGPSRTTEVAQSGARAVPEMEMLKDDD